MEPDILHNDPRWESFRNHEKIKNELVRLRAENAELRAEVREWLCTKCNMVYPGPPQEGIMCVLCPKCGGTTAPRLTVELARLRPIVEAVAEMDSLDTVECPFCECDKMFTFEPLHKPDCPVHAARELVKGWKGK